MRILIPAIALVSLSACGGWEEDCCKPDPEAESPSVADNALSKDDIAVERMEAVNEAVRAQQNTVNSNRGEALETPAYVVPVRYGSDGPEWDACAAYGEVSGLDPNGDNFLSVRAAPSTSAQELDRLGPEQGVWFCDSREGWIGIVYDKSNQLDCGTGTNIASVRDYAGPCKSGWVSERFVTLLAG